MARIPRAEIRRIRKERKALRKSLRKNGITSRREFEEIAFKEGLSLYDDGNPPLLTFWWKLFDRLAGISAMTWLWILLAAIIIVFFYSATSNQNGHFIIALSDDLIQSDFELSDTEDFSSPRVLCASDVLAEVSPYSLLDLPQGLDEGEGSHNMENVVAYTFWVRNNGDHTEAFDWHCVMTSATKGLEQAAWVMIFDQGKAAVYAVSGDDGNPETLTGLDKTTYREELADPGQYIDADPEEGLYGFEAIPYEDRNLVASGYQVELEPGEKRRFTVVIWVEGYDPQCTRDILGGHAAYAFRLVSAGDDDFYGSIRYNALKDENDGESGGLISYIKALFRK